MIESLLRGASRGLAWLGMAGMAAMAIHVTADVMSRSLFNAPLPVTLEMTAHYYMVAVVFFPLAAVEFRNGHISVELVSQHLSAQGRRLLVATVSLLGAVYFAVLTLRTWGDAMRAYEIGEYLYGTWQLGIWPTRFFIPVGCGLLTAVLVWKAVMLLRGRDRLLSEGAEGMREEHRDDGT